MTDDDEELPEGWVNIPAGDVPDVHLEDNEVEGTEWEYSTRGKDDWVISGPLPVGGFYSGRGRPFESWEVAELWARKFYGRRFKGRIAEAQVYGDRWAFLIKGPRGAA